MKNQKKLKICSVVKNITLDTENKSPTLIAGECVVSFLHNNEKSISTYKNYVKQPTLSHKQNLLARRATKVSYFVHPSVIEAFNKMPVYLAIDEVIRWSYKKANTIADFIVFNAFRSDSTIHVDVLRFTGSTLDSIEEIRGMPTSATGYARMLSDEITRRRTGKFRNHKVLLVGNANQRFSENLSDNDTYLDKDILNEMSADVDVLAMAPFQQLKKLVLVESQDSKQQGVFSAALLCVAIIGVGYASSMSVNTYKKSQFTSLVDDYTQIIAQSDANSQDQGLLKLWQTRESYLRDMKLITPQGERLKLILQAISTASYSLPQLSLNVQRIMHRNADENNQFSIDVAAIAPDLEAAIIVGQDLFGELSGAMTSFTEDVIVKGAPRKINIRGKSYFVFTVSGSYSALTTSKDS